MVKAYLVCRTTEVTHAFMVRIGTLTKDSTWYAPVFNDKAKIFTNKASAEAYRNKMNANLHNPKESKDGHFTIDVSPYTDFIIIEVNKA